MISVIQDESTDPMVFNVTIEEQDGKTQHRVTMSDETYKHLFSQSYDPKACIDASFRFLLEREPKESILSSFDITVISQYFPDFAQQISSYLDQ
ncbi:MAG: hypothetical protein V3V89_03305 [Gammaproteobacteria bacterium]